MPTFYRRVIIIGVLVWLLGVIVFFVGQILHVRAAMRALNELAQSETARASDLASEISSAAIYSVVSTAADSSAISLSLPCRCSRSARLS